MMKRYLKWALFLWSGIHLSAQNLPTKAAIIDRMKFVNDYFLSLQGTNMGGNMWARSVYYTGNMACYYTTGDQKYLDQSFRWAETYGWRMYGDDPLTRDADMQCCSQTYIELYNINPSRANISHVRTNIDNLMSTNVISDWSFVDRMYMAMPIFAQLGVLTGNTAYHDRMYAMFSDTKDRRRLFEDTTGLWWRDPGVRPPHLTPNGKHEHWSRGNGWSIGAITRVLKILPANSPYRAAYVDVLRSMAAGLRKVQRPDGFWNVSLEDPNEFPGPETSGTVFFIYGIAYGINEGILDRATYLPVVERAYNAIWNTAIQSDGRLGYVQGPGVRPSDAQPVTNRTTTDYAVGAFLLASAEIYKLTGT
ncbi:MAG: glycoside hydrolase family 88 protein, partial [Cytophagaceae bacterium]|nr:glycoside hydrolase family 88 protein [Cytophagaceae bacterium]